MKQEAGMMVLGMGMMLVVGLLLAYAIGAGWGGE